MSERKRRSSLLLSLTCMMMQRNHALYRLTRWTGNYRRETLRHELAEKNRPKVLYDVYDGNLWFWENFENDSSTGQFFSTVGYNDYYSDTNELHLDWIRIQEDLHLKPQTVTKQFGPNRIMLDFKVYIRGVNPSGTGGRVSQSLRWGDINCIVPQSWVKIPVTWDTRGTCPTTFNIRSSLPFDSKFAEI